MLIKPKDAGLASIISTQTMLELISLIVVYRKNHSKLNLMSEEQLKAFLEKLKGDVALQEKLSAAARPDAVVAIAKAAGFSITTSDISAHRQGLSEGLSDEELEGVSGGGGAGCWTEIGKSFLGLCDLELGTG